MHHWLGRYEILRHLATGGMSEVYLARLRGIAGFERHVVLKTLRPGADDGLVAMFLDEARLLGRLHHTHVVQPYEVGHTPDGIHYLAMEYVHGETLRRVLCEAVVRDTYLPLDFALSLVTRLAAALDHAHGLGIVHRDVSPSNVLAGHDGAVKLIDFGIAKAQGRRAETGVGLVKGKVGYMAPEQLLGCAADARTDLFALGILLYELTTRRRAFPGSSHEAQLEQVSNRGVLPPSHVVAGYPESLERIVMTALAREPMHRYADAFSFGLALEQLARELGLGLGPEPIARTMRELFGVRRPPSESDFEPPPPESLALAIEDTLAGLATPTPVMPLVF